MLETPRFNLLKKGATRCSGGDDGLGCFSTRLMWRDGGKGELYLVRSQNLWGNSNLFDTIL